MTFRAGIVEKTVKIVCTKHHNSCSGIIPVRKERLAKLGLIQNLVL